VDIKWQPDWSSSNCTICQAAFTVLIRRHHCRACGKLICDACSEKKVLPQQSVLQSLILSGSPASRKPRRVCTPCYTGVNSNPVASRCREQYV
jgi:hypothetical protein